MHAQMFDAFRNPRVSRPETLEATLRAPAELLGRVVTA
jgi:hypothetical protein